MYRPLSAVFAALVFALGPCAPGPAQAGSAAERAVEAARAYAGTEITVVWEEGLQALDPLTYSAPLWEELTGIRVRIVEVSIDEIYPRILQNHRAGGSAYDVLNVMPSWMPDLVSAGALEPLDDAIARYGYGEELAGIAPTYLENQARVGDRIYGLPDDGDVFLLFYRRDLFEDAANRAAFEERFGYPLAPPATWQQYDEIAQFFTEKYAPQLYGAGQFRDKVYLHLLFQQRFRAAGGRFFDLETMRATINGPAGIAAFEGMRESNRHMPPGIETWGLLETMSAFLAGETAMLIFWPPMGRWAEGYGEDDLVFSWIPPSQIAGRVGYALPPGGGAQLAVGYSLAVSATSQNKEAAQLFIQWLNSEEISLERVQLPYALRDPFRLSHFESAAYRARWPGAPDYLERLREAAAAGLLDLSILQVDRYDAVLRDAGSRVMDGEDVKAVLDEAAEAWDALTREIGVDRQRAAYLSWSEKPSAYRQ